MSKELYSIYSEFVFEADSKKKAEKKFIDWVNNGGFLDSDVYIKNDNLMFIGKIKSKLERS